MFSLKENDEPEIILQINAIMQNYRKHKTALLQIAAWDSDKSVNDLIKEGEPDKYIAVIIIARERLGIQNGETFQEWEAWKK